MESFLGAGAKRQNGLQGRAWPLAPVRHCLRSWAITAGSLWPASRNPFVRCIYLHNVTERERPAFRQLLREIKNRGEVISTPALTEILKDAHPPPGRYFHLSFDDGFAGAVCDAAAIMVEEKAGATFFVATGFVADAEDDLGIGTIANRARSGTRRPASWSELRQAAAAGFEIGSHSHSHASLAGFSGDTARLKLEIAGSKAIIEQQTGAPCIAFAWPSGRSRDFDAASARIVQQAGFSACFSGVRGSVVAGRTDCLSIPRHLIEAGWPVAHQRAFLAGQWEGRG